MNSCDIYENKVVFSQQWCSLVFNEFTVAVSSLVLSELNYFSKVKSDKKLYTTGKLLIVHRVSTEFHYKQSELAFQGLKWAHLII